MSLLEELRFGIPEIGREVSALLLKPEQARWCFAFAHGAGAGSGHPFMQAMAESLSRHRVATFRYNFPYTEQGRSRPDRPVTLLATVRAAVQEAHRHVSGLPVVAGGKSMGGRMSTLAQGQGGIPGAAGLILLGFPLHQPGKPSTLRADHLSDVHIPMLFLQGDRDVMADLALLKPLCHALDKVSLEVIEGADHSFKVLKKIGKSQEEVLDDLSQKIAFWLAKEL